MRQPQYKHASCCLSSDGLITYLYTNIEHRQKGHATFLMKVLVRWSRRYNKRLHLWIGPYGHPTMNVKQLFNFYSKLGFTRYDPGYKTQTIWMEFVP